MKQRLYTQGVTIYMAPQMYAALRQLSEDRKVSISEVIREMIEYNLTEALNEMSDRKANSEGGTLSGGGPCSRKHNQTLNKQPTSPINLIET